MTNGFAIFAAAVHWIVTSSRIPGVEEAEGSNQWWGMHVKSPNFELARSQVAAECARPVNPLGPVTASADEQGYLPGFEPCLACVESAARMRNQNRTTLR